jgi:hypothetical protein
MFINAGKPRQASTSFYFMHIAEQQQQQHFQTSEPCIILL